LSNTHPPPPSPPPPSHTPTSRQGQGPQARAAERRRRRRLAIDPAQPPQQIGSACRRRGLAPNTTAAIDTAAARAAGHADNGDVAQARTQGRGRRLQEHPRAARRGAAHLLTAQRGAPGGGGGGGRCAARGGRRCRRRTRLAVRRLLGCGGIVVVVVVIILGFRVASGRISVCRSGRAADHARALNIGNDTGDESYVGSKGADFAFFFFFFFFSPIFFHPHPPLLTPPIPDGSPVPPIVAAFPYPSPLAALSRRISQLSMLVVQTVKQESRGRTGGGSSKSSGE
jgi:hypothetical protein